MTWPAGRDTVRRLVADGRLERVEPSAAMADRLLRDADAHVHLAALGVDDDPAGALQLGYDAARKASVALLAVQGLRPTVRGGHVAVAEAVRAQFAGEPGLAVFGQVNRLRRRRNDTEYPSPTTPGVTPAEARRAQRIGDEAIGAARQLLGEDRLDPFA